MDFETILVGLVLNMCILTLLRLFENRSIQIVVHSCTSFGQDDEEEEEDTTTCSAEEEESCPMDPMDPMDPVDTVDPKEKSSSFESKPVPIVEATTFVGVSKSDGAIGK